MDNAMTLSELLARSVIVEAHEAVAIVRDVADRVLEGDPGAHAVPDLRQIRLSPDGRVAITGTMKMGEPVRRLGQLLQALLAQSSPPVQLRLVISQATAPEPAYGSVHDYSEALAYFERPNRAAAISGLYARALESAEVEQSGPPPSLDAIAPLPHADGTPRVPAGNSVPRRRRGLLLVAAVSVLVLAGLVAAAYGRSARFRRSQLEVSAAVVRASDSVGAALVSGVSAVTERAGLGRIVPGADEKPAPPARVETAAAPPRPVRKPHGSVSAFTVYDLDLPADATDEQAAPLPSADATVDDISDAIRHLHAVVNGEPAAAGARSAATPGNRVARAVRPGPADRVAAEAVRGALPDGTIYSSSSHGVAPPVGVRPQLPRQLPGNVDRDTLGRIDLIIAEDGTVESVQLLGNRHTVRDSMMLSAAKAWEFKPALKDGRPVKYRKTVWMAVE